MSEYLIPSCDELSSIFGCDCWIDENHIQTIKFLDESNHELSLHMGHVDDSVRIILIHDSTTVNDIYMEKLEYFCWDENEQTIKMVFNNSYKITIEIKLWSKFLITISGMIT